MIYVNAKCKKCGTAFKLDTGGTPRAKVEEVLRTRMGWHCPGMHVELGSMLDYVEIDWTERTGDDPESEESIGKRYVEEKGIDNVFYLGDAAKIQALIAMGMKNLNDCGESLDHCGMGFFASATHNYDRYDTPRGFRFYLKIAKRARS